jgi:ppGpp synthetase/RelA/SpoT-type nucleotidyltranferase
MTASKDVADAAIARFATERPRYERAGKAVEEVVGEIVARAGVDATLSSRAKEVDSFRAKIVTKAYDDPSAQMTDKAGARALVYRAGEVDVIYQLIEQDGRLEIWNVTDKRAQLGVEQLGYSGLHLDLYAPPEEGDTGRITCELQIRTFAQDAWSVVSHKVLYKPPVELPDRDKRAIMRLVALVEVFDEEVDRVMVKLPVPSAAAAADHAPDLLGLVRAQYARFEDNAGNVELSRAILAVVAAAIDADGATDYLTTLNDFVDQTRDTLRALYDDYGPRSAMATSSDYVLWSQPESVALLECLEHRPHKLLDAWRAVGLPDAWLQPIAAHTSAELDL